MQIDFIELTDTDLQTVKEIYEYYVENSTATFHTGKITVKEMQDLMYIRHPVYKSYLIRADGITCGYCYLAPYKKRQAYNRTAEVTVYLKKEYTGHGIGKLALQRLEEVTRSAGIKVLIGIVTGDNIQSIHLFTRLGYEKCAHFREVGEKFGKILDVVAFQKIL
ncbi:MAG: N-acetyltransferase [Bacteroidales bacterium]|nr:N-acetyltransferase [Bacteroidales bacterium]